MAFETYDELNNEVTRLYMEQKYREVYDLMTREEANFPEEVPLTIYMRSCMAARVGDPDLAMDLIEQAYDRGIWYGETMLRESPSWQVLQGNPRFERLAEMNMALGARFSGKPLTLSMEPEGGCQDKACPLFIALHGNAQSGKSALEGWKQVVGLGWLLAAVQSGVAATVDRYVWDDQEAAVRDVKGQYDKLQQEYKIAPRRTIIAGFSLGGPTALRLALTGAIPAEGFILLGPGGALMDTPEELPPYIEQGRALGLRGYILLGEKDDEQLQELARKAAELLNAGGVPCGLEVLPGLGHNYPQDIAPLQRALAFVEEKG